MNLNLSKIYIYFNIYFTYNYKKTEGEPPASMLAVYDYLHQKFIDHAKEIKVMQQMYMEK